MTRITLYSPEIKAQEVTFRWAIEPSVSLYRQPQFTLRFPSGVDLTAVDAGIWWRVALICLHSHWVLLRPCRIHLPISLLPGEAEMWLRLMDVEIATLEVYRGTTQFAREIEIIEDGPLCAPVPLPERGRCATAFSGGKDSLLQTGLLTELSERPVLVTTTSPTLVREDHLTPRRREVLDEIKRRRSVEFIEVESDYRANLAEKFAQQIGYPIALNEMSDTFLYLGVLIAAGAACGATHFFIASEAEVQESVEIDGRVIQHKHFMYSQISLSAIDAAIRPWGITCGSLTSPLYSYQVQQILWTRYRDLRDLQYSCWQVKGDQSTCSACSQCLRLSIAALALGEQPQVCGFDLTKVLIEMNGWRPRRSNGTSRLPLPSETISVWLHAQTLRSVLAIRMPALARALIGGEPLRVLTPRFWRAVASFFALRQQAMDYRPSSSPGYRAGVISSLDPLLSGRVASIYAEHFLPEAEKSYAQIVERSKRTSEWITEPLRAAEQPTSLAAVTNET
jgi:hypothetical protein